MQDCATGGFGEDAVLLPWHATGRLTPFEDRRLAVALDRDRTLARDLASVRREQAAAVDLHERLGTPSPRALSALFAAIDADAALPKIST